MTLSSMSVKRYLPKLNRNIVELIAIFLFFTIIFFSGYSSLCKQYSASDFDAQNFIAWDYSAHQGAVLYKDLLYYYGPLFFYKSVFPWAAVIFSLLTPLTLAGFYLIFKKIFNSRFFSLVSIVALSIYILIFIGESSWNRNGTGALVVTIIAYLFSLKKINRWITHVFLGIVTGLVFSIIHDQGVYIGFVYTFLLSVSLPIDKGLKILFTPEYYRRLISYLFYYLIGFAIGFLPFALYLIQQSALIDFFHSLSEVSHMGLFAKIPYLPYVSSKDNLIIFTTIFLTVIVGVLVFLFNKVKKYNSIFYTQLALTIYILILQQKNILRSMGGAMGIFCLILLMVFYAYIKIIFEKHQYQKISIYYFYLLLLTSFFIFIQPFSLNNLESRFIARFSLGFTQELKMFSQSQEIQQCQQSSFEINRLPITPDHKAVFDLLQQEPNFNGRIFSFPSDPIFYVIFKQIVAPYSTIYEASHLSAQQKNIAYIEINSIKYVIYNQIGTNVDEVPAILRGNAISRYLLNNFDFYRQIGSFIILKKAEDPDPFTHVSNKDFLPIINTLLTNNLKYIPYEEGLYKYLLFSTSSDTEEIFAGSIYQLRAYLKSAEIKSDSTVLAVSIPYSEQTTQDNTTLRITADNGLITTVIFHSCNSTHPCLLNLQNIPLFFKNRRIKQIEAPNQPELQIKLFKVSSYSQLW